MNLENITCHAGRDSTGGGVVTKLNLDLDRSGSPRQALRKTP